MELTTTKGRMIDLFRHMFSRFFRRLRKVGKSENSSSIKRERTWNVIKVHHIGIATGNFDKSIELYRDILGIQVGELIPMPEHGVLTYFAEMKNVKVELLVPLGEKNPLKNFLKRNVAGGIHHICLDVDNINNAVKDLKEKTLTEGAKVGAHGKPVIFLHPKDCGGVLIELQQI